ncbi:RuBisCO large subunit-binding protein subunit beta, chloroplastic [Capsicum chinense]|nr:RuBisCO large subunit-binding protein subunit beta, chloroplastic [Capsicum chinense]
MRAEPKKLKIAENAEEEIGIIEKMILPVEKMYSAMQLPLIDKKITNDRDLANVLEDAIINGYPILIIAEDNEQDVASTLVVNNLRGSLQATAVKSPDFGE